MIILNEELNKESDAVNKLVDKVIELYMSEDYDYAVSQTSKGIELVKGEDFTIDTEVGFLKRNGLIPEGISDSELRTAAEMIINKIKEIEDEIYSRFSK